jgi:hypothetical protein
LQRAVALDEHADVGLDQGLESVGEEAIEGLLPEDEVVLDAEYTVEKEEGDERASVLDDLTEKMDRDEPDEYVKLWAKGNDIFGDEEWGKTVTALKKKVGAKPEDRMNDEQKINLMALMEAAIKKGG